MNKPCNDCMYSNFFANLDRQKKWEVMKKYRNVNRCRDGQDQTHDADEQAGDGHREEEEESAEESFEDVVDDVLDASRERL